MVDEFLPAAIPGDESLAGNRGYGTAANERCCWRTAQYSGICNKPEWNPTTGMCEEHFEQMKEWSNAPASQPQEDQREEGSPYIPNADLVRPPDSEMFPESYWVLQQ